MDKSSGDEIWKDSFDKLLEPRPQLCKLNIIKESVRYSYNIDTSVENSSHSIKGCSPKSCNQSVSISTPNYKRFGKELFNCGLSPINRVQLDGFGDITEKFNADQDAGLIVPPKNQIDKSYKLTFYRSKQRFSNQTNKVACASNQSNKIVGAVLKPGKWRKSLNIFRQTQISALNESKKLENRNSVCQDRKSIFLNGFNKQKVICQQDFLKYCNQVKPLKFNAAYAQHKMLKTYKIGEGAYGEVFRYTPNRKGCKNDLVLKIIPIEGSIEVNGEKQKKFGQIWPEIIITKKLSSTQGFASIEKVSTVNGKYPQHFVKLWERYDDEKGSENDHPGLFEENQLFVVLELHFAGSDMSNVIFFNSEQSYYALQQIILTLAVGEEDYQFEHRDLHWGNILIKSTTKKHICFKFNNTDLIVDSKGVNITIIDYTLSRITIDECCYFNDLSNDEELFQASGDYQYDIYRMMRNELKNNWSLFSPKANILWLSYIIAKLMDSVKYKSINSKVHRLHFNNLKELQSIILLFESGAHCARHMFNLREANKEHSFPYEV
ncbi:putative serine/threonine-protein kinase haspin homolog isoform X2 [Drosophila subpulchrella]|uniref:putative serine/threonine-protein kinase haspin homolog isoform X2 n=1 Tax=Drosophila subpulchrella TaxID=1486046 RepID=UPI0018A16E09|nr:putative serine/threonine-protein kinase haspin homolog isoform X2 [Drosophila subpulchrella]XP_037728567.1 putative serine/threonine-protein kinase haspin homolog isoform X2 [Drosophila subpulchrella]